MGFPILLLLLVLRFNPIHGIVGGQSALPGTGSGVVLIDNCNFYARIQHYCTGALISSRFVLTNGNCCAFPTPAATTITIGTVTPFEEATLYYVDEFVEIGNSSWKFYQLCLIRLDREVVFNSHTMPYALPSKGNVMDSKIQFFDLFGFGASELQRNPDQHVDTDDIHKVFHHQLQRLERDTFLEHPLKECEKFYNTFEPNSLKYKCFGSESANIRLMPNDEGAPFVGRTDRVLYTMAVTDVTRFNHKEYDWMKSGNINYHIDIAEAAPLILEGIKKLTK